jgi:hypothetical protein
LNEISSKNFKFLNGPKFNSCISISYTIKKNSPKNSTHNLSFELYLQFLQFLWQLLFCHKYTPYVQFFFFCWIFKLSF